MSHVRSPLSELTELRRRMLSRIPQSRGSWYDIRAQEDEDKAVVRIYDFIDPMGVTAEDFVNELDEITASEIEVQINSPGGLVFDGIAIFNALRTHPARVTTRVDGIAASAASVIVQAGDRRVMVESSQLMIHEAWGMAIGPANEMRELADLLDKQNGIIAGIYAARSEKPEDEFRDLMTSDTYLTDEETVDLGLADEVFTPPRQEGPDNRTRSTIRAGERLGNVLDGLIDDKAEADDMTRTEVMEEMAEEADISVSTVQQIVSGDITCPPLERLEAFAEVLQVPTSDLTDAAEQDGCEYDDTEARLADTWSRIRAFTKRMKPPAGEQQERPGTASLRVDEREYKGLLEALTLNKEHGSE